MAWTYDDAGNITSRTEYAYTTGTPGTVVDTVSYTYGDTSWGDLLTAYDGVSITHDEIGNPLTDGTQTQTDTLYFAYDASGTPMSVTLGESNPLRYRGYVYDDETGLYYLQSRYYIPELGRFINADAFTSTGQGLLGNDMFSYCLNNPVSYSDSGGTYATVRHQFSYDSMDALAGCGGAGGGGAIVILFPVFADIVEDTSEKVKAWVQASADTKERRDQHVYVLIDPQNDYTVKYVGRTNQPSRRFYEHQNDPRHPERKEYQMKVLIAGLTIKEAALMEQVLISAYSLDYLMSTE